MLARVLAEFALLVVVQWDVAGLGDYFARATDGILPDQLLERVAAELLVFENYEKQERQKSVEGGTVS